MSWWKINPNRDYLKWVAAGCALVATASAEYEIARAVHMPWFVACAVPGALDAYVLRALRAHREVLTAVLAMVAVNAASHLVTAGVLVVEWGLITAVSAIPPLVLWRVHALSTPGEARRRKLWGRSTPEHAEHETVPHPSTGERDVPSGPVTAEWDRDWLPDFLEDSVREEHTSVLAVRKGAVGVKGAVGIKGPDAVREEHVDVFQFGHEEPVVVIGKHTPVLSIVPPLPGGFEDEHMPEARMLDKQARKEHGEVVSQNTLKTVLRVGTPRAKNIQDALIAEHAESTGDKS